MKSRVFAAVPAAALILMLASGSAWARNPHCAGGIQYLTQALADKQRNNTEDYQREIQKAVMQLEACASEDPADFEAIGYLGWAYGEVDSIPAAAKAFQTAIDGLTSKGDKKKLELVQNNRESFWATSFNKGIASINTAQGLWNPYLNKPANADEQKQKDGATKNYNDAIISLQRALALKPTDSRTLRNLGTVYAFMGDYSQAEQLLAQGLKAAPGDTDLTAALRSARAGRANQLLEEKQYEQAVHYYQQLLKDDPKNGDLWAGLGDAAFAQARAADGDARKTAFCTAADAYAKAGALKPASMELPFNSAICYQSCGDLAASEGQWKAALKLKGDDREALMNMSTVLADEKKFPEAIDAAMKAVALDPKDKTGHRQLGAIYSKAGDNLHSKQALLAYLALEKGTTSDKPSEASGADGVKLSAKLGQPEAIYLWEADGQKYETWFYWTKGQAYHFGGGTQQEKTDWSAALAAK